MAHTDSRIASDIESYLAAQQEKSLLRFITCGSVDDGKSTLIGRFLYESKLVFEDHLAALEADSKKDGTQGDNVDLALLVDGLAAEREQGITIDVAYRYFSTERRKFVVADTPGHEQYTRNMVTGASTADVALILIDARHGIVEQTRRHAFLATLLGIPHLMLCVNKMDLVGYEQERFDAIREEFTAFSSKLEVADLTFIPVSALTGDNVVGASTTMPWYEGAPLLGHLEGVHVASDRNLIDTRMPVQYVIRPQQSGFHDFRGYAGTIAGGVIRPGDEVVVLPSGFSTKVTHVRGPGGLDLEEACAGQAVTVEIADALDVSRGDMLCRPNNRPTSTQDVDAMLCWMDGERRLSTDATYAVLHTTRETRATVEDLEYGLDINTLHRVDVADLGLNEIGRVRLRTQKPLHLDPYRRNRETGSFILIDEVSNHTVAAGIILGESRHDPHIAWHSGAVTRAQRRSTGTTLWMTGLSGSGKSSVAVEVERRLVASGQPAYVLDGDNLRHGLNADLGFSPQDRAENARRVAEVATILADAGVVAIVSLVSPYRVDRDAARAAHAAADLPFIEIFMDTPLEVAEERDVKGLYAKARRGEIPDFTGISAPYEPPLRPELVLRPGDGDVAALAGLVLDRIDQA